MSKWSTKLSKSSAKLNNKRRGGVGGPHNKHAGDTGPFVAKQQYSSKDDAARKAASIPPNCSCSSLLDDISFVDEAVAVIKAHTAKLLADFNVRREGKAKCALYAKKKEFCFDFGCEYKIKQKHHQSSSPSHCVDHACQHQHHPSPNSAADQNSCYLCLLCGAGPFCELHATKHSQTTSAVSATAAAVAGKHHHHSPKTPHAVLANLRTQVAVCFSCPPTLLGPANANFHALRNSSLKHPHNRHTLPNSRLTHAFRLYQQAIQLHDDYASGYLKNVSTISSTLHGRYLRDLAAHPYYALHGIENLSNTCCLSVVLQALIKTPVFREYMLARLHNCNNAASRENLPSEDFAQCDVYKCLTCALSKAAIDMFTLPVGDVFDPCSIVCSVKRILAARNWQWSSTEQHDPAEILDKLLETIEREAELAGEASRISPALSGRRQVVMRSTDDGAAEDEKLSPIPTTTTTTTKRAKVSNSQPHFTSLSRTRHPSSILSSSSGSNSVEIVAHHRTPSPPTGSRMLRSASGGKPAASSTSPTVNPVDNNKNGIINSPVLTDNFIDVIFRGLILLIRRCPDCIEGDSVTVDKFTILYLSIDHGSDAKAAAAAATTTTATAARCSSFVTSSRNSSASSSSSSIVSANQMTNSSTETANTATNNTLTTTTSSNPNSTGGNTTENDDDDGEEDDNRNAEALSSASTTAASTPVTAALSPAAAEPQPSSTTPTTNNITLQQCIDGFVSEHVLDNVMCNICAAKQKLQKTRFALLPPVLIFTLKRYSTQSRKKSTHHHVKSHSHHHHRQHSGGENSSKPRKSSSKPSLKKSSVKAENFADAEAASSPAAAAAISSGGGTYHKSQVIVDYPLELDMSPYCADRFIMPTTTTTNEFVAEKTREADNTTNSLYELYAVVQHLGQELDKGHYVCWVKHISGKWFYFDDRNVLHSNLEYVLTREAYMLFYRRKRLVSDVEQLISEMRLSSEALAAANQQNDRFEQTAMLQNVLAKDVMEIDEQAGRAAAAAKDNTAAGATGADGKVTESMALSSEKLSAMD